MAMNESLVGPWPVASGGKVANRHETIVLVQWALAMACAYLVLFSQKATDTLGPGVLVIVAFLAWNLVVGRLRPETVGAPRLSILIAAVDTVLIAASLAVAGQLSVELLVLCLGILVLAIGGVRLGPIAVVTLGMAGAYLLMVWIGGAESVWGSSMLLRVPFLFTAAIVYAWLMEIGRHGPAAEQTDRASRADVTGDLSAQLYAIARCRAALSEGSTAAVEGLLNEIAAQNQSIRTKVVSQ